MLRVMFEAIVIQSHVANPRFDEKSYSLVPDKA